MFTIGNKNNVFVFLCKRLTYCIELLLGWRVCCGVCVRRVLSAGGGVGSGGTVPVLLEIDNRLDDCGTVMRTALHITALRRIDQQPTPTRGGKRTTKRTNELRNRALYEQHREQHHDHHHPPPPPPVLRSGPDGVRCTSTLCFRRTPPSTLSHHKSKPACSIGLLDRQGARSWPP